MLTVAVPKRNKLPNIIVLTPKDGAAAAAKVAPPVYANRFNTLTGRPADLIFSENQSQFTACSGNNPVCLKLKGFKLKVRSR